LKIPKGNPRPPGSRLKTLSTIGFAILGACLIAISYGLARFAFGLFVPPMRADLGLGADMIGLIGAIPFISFVIATLFAPIITTRFGARNTAILSGGLGTGGLAVMSQADSALVLGGGIFACGMCTGLMMPSLTSAMQAVVKRAMHGRVTAVMNAGTSIGVVVAVPAALFLVGQWRLAYISFAILAGIGMLAAWFFIPSVSRVQPADAEPAPAIGIIQWTQLIRLSLFAFSMGFIASGYWVFAPDLVVNLSSLPADQTGWLWLAVGLAGLSGAVISDLSDRNGPAITHALALVTLSASLALLAASPGQLFLAIISAMVFGVAYMSLSGLYLLTGIHLLPGRPSVGPVLPFLAIALGQAAGSPAIGLAIKHLDYGHAFALFSTFGLFIALLSPLYPRHFAHEDQEAPQESGSGTSPEAESPDPEGPQSEPAGAAND
jgi:predicted MFS family arabinose efflux permease